MSGAEERRTVQEDMEVGEEEDVEVEDDEVEPETEARLLDSSQSSPSSMLGEASH